MGWKLTHPILFSTLYPEDVDVQRARENTLDTVGHLAAAGAKVGVLAGSAHRAAAAHMREALAPLVASGRLFRADVMHVPFHMQDVYADRRSIEISFSKQVLLAEAAEAKGHVLLFVDSDVLINKDDLARYLGKFNPAAAFINFPYTLRDRLAAPAETLGAYAVLADNISPAAVSKTFTMTVGKDGKTVGRKGAPDCRLRGVFLEEGLSELRAENITSHHYGFDGSVMVYAHGRCARKGWTR